MNPLQFLAAVSAVYYPRKSKCPKLRLNNHWESLSTDPSCGSSKPEASWSPPLSLGHKQKRSKNLISLKIFAEWFLWYRSSKRNLPDLELSLANWRKVRWSLSPLPLSWLYMWWPARRWKAFRTRRKRNALLAPARCLRRILDRWFCLKHPWWRYLVRRLSRLAWISRPLNIPYRNVGSEWPVISFVVLKSPYSEISLIWNIFYKSSISSISSSE